MLSGDRQMSPNDVARHIISDSPIYAQCSWHSCEAIFCTRLNVCNTNQHASHTAYSIFILIRMSEMDWNRPNRRIALDGRPSFFIGSLLSDQGCIWHICCPWPNVSNKKCFRDQIRKCLKHFMFYGLKHFLVRLLLFSTGFTCIPVSDTMACLIWMWTFNASRDCRP